MNDFCHAVVGNLLHQSRIKLTQNSGGYCQSPALTGQITGRGDRFNRLFANNSGAMFHKNENAVAHLFFISLRAALNCSLSANRANEESLAGSGNFSPGIMLSFRAKASFKYSIAFSRLSISP